MGNIFNAMQSYIGGHFAEVAFIVLAAGAVFIFSLGVSTVVLALSGPVRRRLDQLASRDAPPVQDRAARVVSMLQPVTPYLMPKAEQERSRVAQLLSFAGYRSPNALPIFYACKALLFVGLPLVMFASAPFFPKARVGMLIAYCFIAAVIGFLAPSIWLDNRTAARQASLRVAFPDALDLLVVCVESGLGLAAALQRVADELVISHPELGSELARVNAEMRAGVERAQALRNLADRTGLEDIRGLVALLIQTLRFGTSIADALRLYSEEFRDKRMQAAEEQAAKIATKMIFPLVLCLFPAFFLVAVGPAIIRIIAAFQQMGH
jgi:tight adherence protein C